MHTSCFEIRILADGRCILHFYNDPDEWEFASVQEALKFADSQVQPTPQPSPVVLFRNHPVKPFPSRDEAMSGTSRFVAPAA